MTKPLVSIAMPIRNGRRTIAAAVRSILDQTFQCCELIVIDDGSDDGTYDELLKFTDQRIAVLPDGQRKGVSARSNEVIARACDEYFAKMDADDVSYPRRLEPQLKY